ncbi:MAG: hypothetical protein N3G21_02280 [Candidatus Hydrogenedentes bacterium]|nr:hypothetical protein [Candidatus Hydrogenedentota bacterium]
MPLASCARCGKMFSKKSSPVCSSCQKAEDEDIEKVRKVAQEIPNLSAEELAEKANVDISVVLRMIDMGLLVNILESSKEVRCGMCGAPAISITKKLCQACLEKLNVEVLKAQSQIKLEAKKPPKIGESLNVHEELERKRKEI